MDDPARLPESKSTFAKFIRDNSDTVFGRENRLAEVRTQEQFVKHVPVRDYDEMQPWIDRIRRGEPRVMTAEPVRRLVPTSGSTAARKLIPYTDSMHHQLNRAIGPWIFNLYRHLPRALLGSSYWSISPSSDGKSGGDENSSVPIGFDDDAAYLGGWRKRLVDLVMAAPAGLKDITSTEDWRYATVLSLLRRRDLSLISIWHPSFLALLLNTMRRSWDMLLADVRSGTCALTSHIPPTVAVALQVSGDAERAEELSRAGPTALEKLWPKLAVVSCWADGHAASASAELARSMGSIDLQPKGLLATEGVISIPFEGMHPLAIRSHYLEFEDDTGRMFLASDLQKDCAYSVVLLAIPAACQYRYHIDQNPGSTDARSDEPPSIRFIAKSGLISDRMGEKLSDGFVATVFACLFENYSPQPSFAMLAPDRDADGYPVYRYLNADARRCT